MEFETWYRSTLAAKLNASDNTCTVANAPTVTKWRMHVYKGNTHSWIKFTWVSGNILTGVTFVSQTTDPITTVAWVTYPAWSNIELVEMHDQMFNAEEGGTITGDVVVTGDVSVWDDLIVTGDTVMWATLKVPVYADATARDAAITSPANGMVVYLTSEGYFTDYQWGVWNIRSTWTAVWNATQTVAGKVEMSTTSEFRQGTATWWTWASLVVTPAMIAAFVSFGDGSDGDVTISSPTTLTRDMYYNDLVLSDDLTTGWYAVYVRGTCSWTGKIIYNGNNWGNASGWTGWTAAAALASGTCGANLGGAAWASWWIGAGTNWTAWTAVNPSYATTSTTSAGWGAWGWNPTNGWTWGATAISTRWEFYNTRFNLANLLATLYFPARAIRVTTPYGGLPSAWSGASWAWNWGWTVWGGGGAAGWNGGIMFLFIRWISGSWTIEAKWGNGGNGAQSPNVNCGGGGGWGGGSGGFVVLVTNSSAPTITLTGGSAGTGGAANWGSSIAGSNGTAGTVWQSLVITV